jgi:CYTH domain-containing protein
MLKQGSLHVPPFGIDVLERFLQGPRLAEAEFASDADSNDLIIPDYILHEVTKDERFTGGQPVSASRRTVANWLAEYGIARLLLDDAQLESRGG